VRCHGHHQPFTIVWSRQSESRVRALIGSQNVISVLSAQLES
jgi:hypothetical protein